MEIEMRYTTIYNDPVKRSTITEPWCYWDGAFTNEELQKIIDYCESQELSIGTTYGNTDKEQIEKVRISKIGFHSRSPETAWIFDRVNFVLQSANEMFYGFELNGYTSFQYTTYDAEQKGNYDWHMDMNMGSPTEEFEPRKLSLTLLLNDDFEGGEFHLNTGNQLTPAILPAQKGRALLFPSFMCHRVTPVTKGRRRSLVVWCLGPKFV
jgi:PKHD-type hydroxylase